MRRVRSRLPGMNVQRLLDGSTPLLDEVNKGRLDLVFPKPGETGAGMVTRLLVSEEV